jgi:hypothetical protein
LPGRNLGRIYGFGKPPLMAAVNIADFLARITPNASNAQT